MKGSLPSPTPKMVATYSLRTTGLESTRTTEGKLLEDLLSFTGNRYLCVGAGRTEVIKGLNTEDARKIKGSLGA